MGENISQANLDMIFKKTEQVQYKKEKDIVTIIRPQNTGFQNFLRKLKAKIPEHTYLELDEYGSLAFTLIDGKTTVEEIGKQLSETFPDDADHLYTRLLLFLHHLQTKEKIIELIEKENS